MRIPAVAREIGGMMEGLLTGIARGELDDGKERTAHHVDDTGFCTVRGADGTERLMSAADADLGTVVELMECAYSAYQDESVKDNAGYIMKHYDVLRGKTPPAGGYPRKECFGINGSRFDW
ncbi:hypothetical protein [Akkermansia sp.]|uniref:hypothetical protein n=1 Tax=Akkermansia sp. TaxID=1872421 RepID=UPI003AB8C360